MKTKHGNEIQFFLCIYEEIFSAKKTILLKISSNNSTVSDVVFFNMHVLILNKHVVCAHIPHASLELSEKHIYQEATILPTLKRVSRGLSHKAPPSIRISCSDCNVTGAYAVTIFRHTLTFAREEFFQQERMQPTVIS